MDSLHSVVPRALTELFRQGPMSQGKLEVAWRVAVGDALDPRHHRSPAARWRRRSAAGRPAMEQRAEAIVVDDPHAARSASSATDSVTRIVVK